MHGHLASRNTGSHPVQMYCVQWHSMHAMQDAWAAAHIEHFVPLIRARLGVPASAVLAASDVTALWALCCIEQSTGARSNVCALFTPAEHARMEWIDDVAFLNKRGWAHTINYDIAAPLLRDAAAALRSAAAPPAERLGMQGRFLFGHAETLAPLLCHLGLFGSPEHASARRAFEPESRCLHNNPGLRAFSLRNTSSTCAEVGLYSRGADLWADEASVIADIDPSSAGSNRTHHRVGGLVLLPEPPEDRLWRGSHVSPYGANVMFVVYQPTCEPRGADARVAVVLNERVLHADVLPGAHDGLLPLADFVAYMEACAARADNRTTGR